MILIYAHMKVKCFLFFLSLSLSYPKYKKKSIFSSSVLKIVSEMEKIWKDNPWKTVPTKNLKKNMSFLFSFTCQMYKEYLSKKCWFV